MTMYQVYAIRNSAKVPYGEPEEFLSMAELSAVEARHHFPDAQVHVEPVPDVLVRYKDSVNMPLRRYYVREPVDGDGHQDEQTEIWVQDGTNPPEMLCLVTHANLRRERTVAATIADALNFIAHLAKPDIALRGKSQGTSSPSASSRTEDGK